MTNYKIGNPTGQTYSMNYTLLQIHNLQSIMDDQIPTNIFVLEYFRVASIGVFPPQLPDIKERFPVNV